MNYLAKHHLVSILLAVLRKTESFVHELHVSGQVVLYKPEENREYKSFTGFKRIVRGKFDYAQLNSWLNRHIKTCLYVDTEMLHVNRIINVNSEFVKILDYRQHCSKIQSKDNPKWHSIFSNLQCSLQTDSKRAVRCNSPNLRMQ